MHRLRVRLPSTAVAVVALLGTTLSLQPELPTRPGRWPAEPPR